MFELLGAATGIWRELLHLSEWTGLSVGVLVGLGALAWFFPPARSLAIIAGLVVVAGYGGLLYGNKTGRADVIAQWDAANVRAEQERIERDARIAAELEAKYGPVIADIKKQSDDLQTQVGTYEKQILAKNGGSCVLGDAALALRLRIKRR